MDFEEMGTIEECRVKMLLVVDALKANCPISDMTVELDGESILLQDFLLDVPRITEVDAHFRGWPLFNIYSSLPDGLKKFPEKMNIDGFDAQKLLKRFELYTWRAKSHLMEAYFQTLKHVRRVSTAKLPFDANPNLSRTLENFLRGPQFKDWTPVNDGIYRADRHEYDSLAKVNLLKEQIKKIEHGFADVPPNAFWYFLTKKGREIEDVRLEMLNALSPKLKKQASDIFPPLRQLGIDYRIKYLEERNQSQSF